MEALLMKGQRFEFQCQLTMMLEALINVVLCMVPISGKDP